MKKLIHFMESEKGLKIKNSLVCFGASVVLAGALFKIMHWPGAGPMLTAGMLTEVFLFAMFGILPPHKDYHWEKIHPGLDLAPDLDPDFDPASLKESKKREGQGSMTQQLDDMLVENKVEPEVIERLGDNLRRLGESMTKLSDGADASEATNEYSAKAKEAASVLAEMKDAYSSATQAVNELSSNSSEAAQTYNEATRSYAEEMQSVSKNLTALNAVYETELQDTNNHLKSINQFYGNLSAAMESLEESVEDTRKYKEQISSLATNLSSLNQVYGNMLSAMSASGVTPKQQREEV